MPARSSVVLKLPPALRDRLDARIINTNFGRYAEHAAWLGREGQSISVSALQRYGARLREQWSPELARVAVSGAKARSLTDELRSHGDDFLMSEAANALIHERIFELIVNPELDIEQIVALRELARSVNASTQAQVRVSREKRARSEAEGTGRKTKRRGLSREGSAHIRSQVEGSSR